MNQLYQLYQQRQFFLKRYQYLTKIAKLNSSSTLEQTHSYNLNSNNQMLSTCFSDEACNFMYQCINGACVHQSVFPLQVYPSIVYLLIPIACGLCNLTGNSMGMFKIIILMNLLRYSIGDATSIIQALVIGAAFPNFFTIIFQKHPNNKTSLVNYNLVLVFIPCSLYGSTLGALTQSILPQFIQDLLILFMFTYFSVSFIGKIRKYFKREKQQKRQSLLTIQDSLEHKIQYSQQNDRSSSGLKQENEFNLTQNNQQSAKHAIKEQQQQQQNIQNAKNLKNNQKSAQTIKTAQSNEIIQIKQPKLKKKSIKTKKIKDPQTKRLKKQIKTYQKSIHLKDIFKTILIFLVFQLLAFFAQGKIPFLQFSKCSFYYPMGLVILTAVVILYLFYLKGQMVEKFNKYKQIKFKTQIDLSKVKNFRNIALGALTAGFIQGTLGLGAGTFLMLVLLGFPIDPRVAAATTGYQILFTGSGAMVQQFINNKLKWQVALFFFLWTAIGGGIVTNLMYRASRNMNAQKVKKLLLIIISVLCILSLILIFPITIQRIIQQGWSYMFQAHFEC